MASTWYRKAQTSTNWIAGALLLAQVPQGKTILRTHFQWGLSGYCSTNDNLMNVAQSILVVGLVTVIGTGTETPPNALSASADQHPPTQRWIWWEGRAPRIVAYDGLNQTVWWQDSPQGQPTDSHSQVLATAIPMGQNLDVWASWAATADWPGGGQISVWVSSSILST